MSHIKKKLFSHCLSLAEERIRTSEQAITSAREASENDTKSSAGDKYETTREMMQQEISRNEIQLLEARKQKHLLSSINPERTCTRAENGSVVITNQGSFYLAISAGQVVIDGTTYYVISTASPIGQRITGLKQGEFFQFNNKEYRIEDIY
ncbi:3-oxoacyl-ACP synthase [Pedobacter sp. SYSU D00535]|uniref:3-oxoacyl-ACP synthase n=1 Tax=Pedobacter sp. SYSU D00535 TaxID=2810308 RepID=UPI001A975400|nr:3-oxoacyl-ACP synthase [Pedobacter sp. SYSU D00535]